jgi:ParB family chromosome partitioning protein
MTQATAPAAVLEHLNPAELLMDANVRTDMRLDPAFVESIRDDGVLVPLVGVRTASGQVRVRYGHRRALAAIQAAHPTVPVFIAADETGGSPEEIDRILTQYAENTHREALTAAEQAGVVSQLLDLGLTTGQIQRKTRMKKDDVTAAQRVAASELAGKTAAEYDLTLDQAAALAEFDADTAAVGELVAAAQEGHGRFAHQLQRARSEAAERAVLDAERARLEADGVTVTDQYPTWSDHLGELLDAKGKKLTPRNHAKCPGHSAYLRSTWHNDGPQAYAVWFCADPNANGHKRARNTGQPETDSEAVKEERRRVLAGNKDWRAATTVRRTWLKELLARKAPPPGALRFVLEAFARSDATLQRAIQGYDTRHKVARELLGIPEAERTGTWSPANEVLDAMATASETRAQVIALAVVAGAYEDRAADVQSWRAPGDVIPMYLTALTSWGYEASDIEQTILQPGEK